MLSRNEEERAPPTQPTPQAPEWRPHVRSGMILHDLPRSEYTYLIQNCQLFVRDNATGETRWVPHLPRDPFTGHATRGFKLIM